MLIWNALLAFIPVVMVLVHSKIKEKKVLAIFIFLLWLIFYPNSVYLVTDLIYLESSNYIESLGLYQGLLYLQDFGSYLALFHFIIAAFMGGVFAYHSFTYFFEECSKINLKTKILFFIFIPFIASIGIYIGRFLRYNSWDVLNVLSLTKDFIQSLDLFSLFFILGFTVLQYVFLGYPLIYKKIKG